MREETVTLKPGGCSMHRTLLQAFFSRSCVEKIRKEFGVPREAARETFLRLMKNLVNEGAARLVRITQTTTVICEEDGTVRKGTLIIETRFDGKRLRMWFGCEREAVIWGER